MSTTGSPTEGYRISEVARLTGFTPTTLRFYEDAGVVSPAARTAAGYRAYGDRDVERLRLIARAKDLGCTLEEIAGLVQAWDGEECGPVKQRLRSLVERKVSEAEQHIADQAGFAAQLRATAAALTTRPVDGPCDAVCGCTTSVGEIGAGDAEAGGCGCSAPDARSAADVPVAFVAAGGGARPPIACSLDGGDMQTRIDEWGALLTQVEERTPIPGGLRLAFGPSPPLAEIARLAAAEQGCCPFFGFAVTIDARGTALEVVAPADGQGQLAALFGGAT